jgi:hypothetical protein
MLEMVSMFKKSTQAKGESIGGPEIEGVEVWFGSSPFRREVRSGNRCTQTHGRL